VRHPVVELNKHIFISSPEKVIKLPNEKWEDYIPRRPQCKEDDTDEGGDIINEETGIPVEEVRRNAEEEDYVSQGAEQQGLLLETEVDSDSSLFGAEEYGDIVGKMQPEPMDMQLSTITVFDPDEMQVPGKLY
jgi:hypothetical protein